VSNEPQVDSNGSVVACGVRWERNTGNLTFAAPVHIIMPTLKWADPDRDSNVNAAYDGGAHANVVQSTNAWENTIQVPEGCALNYQLTWFANSRFTQRSCNPDGSSCPSPSGVCSNGNDCTSSSLAPTYLAFRWMDVNGDGLIDLVASVAQGGQSTYDLLQGNGLVFGSQPPGEPDTFGFSRAFPCPAGLASPVGTYTMCGGRAPWFIYLNHGNATFGLAQNGFLAPPWPNTIAFQPMALETADGDPAGGSTLLGGPMGAQQGSLDVDADGLIDGVFGGGNASAWGVARNTGTGGVRGHHLVPLGAK
jgi:hypothetical protein